MTSSYPARKGQVREHLAGAWLRLATAPAPAAPSGQVAALANRILTYTNADTVPCLLDHLDAGRGGLILAGGRAPQRLRLLEQAGYDGIVLHDPAAYLHYAATIDAPFWLPDGQLVSASLDDMLDQQRRAGAAAALLPTGYIAAGRTDVLKAAARMVKAIDRDDIIFVVPLDISLADTAFIDATIAILADCGAPVGLILGRQDDPLTQSKAIIPNLRDLVLQVPTLPMRTDFNALDLIAHGAFAAAIGTGGSVRKTVAPPGPSLSRNLTDNSPSVLFPEVLSWWRGSKIAKLYGARTAARCDCTVCDGRQLSRFLGRSDRLEAVAHAVSVWTRYGTQLLDQPTVYDRAVYWQNLSKSAIDEHAMITTRLRMIKPLQPQRPLGWWATLPAWPTDLPAVP